MKWLARIADIALMVAPPIRRIVQARRARKQGKDPLDRPLRSQAEVERRKREG